MLIFLLVLLCILSITIIILKNEESTISTPVNNSISEIMPKTVKDVIEDHDSEYISQDGNKVYSILA